MSDKSRSRTVVAVSGGFDPFHQGHVAYFLAARKLGDQLVVLLDSDEFVEKKHRVLVPQVQRAAVLKELRCVDLVLCSKGPDVSDLLEALRPDYYCVGSDHKQIDALPEYDACVRCNIKIVPLNVQRMESSTRLVEVYESGRD